MCVPWNDYETSGAREVGSGGVGKTRSATISLQMAVAHRKGSICLVKRKQGKTLLRADAEGEGNVDAHSAFEYTATQQPHKGFS